MTVTVAVVGGGYGGTKVAKALDDIADVVLVEPKDRFVHNVAALRGLVNPDWVDRLFFSYDRLLDRGRVIRDRAVRVDGTGITLGSGERLAADYIVLATGSAYPFPAKFDVEDSAAAKAKLRETHYALAGSDNVLLLGAGAVGLELAGEIKAVWPDKAVTIVDPSTELLASEHYPAEFRTELRDQLHHMGVELVLGSSLAESPPSDAGVAKRFTASTGSGREFEVDIWFQCFGVAPVSDYLVDELATARRANGHLDVTAELRLPGQQHVFAIGDLTALPEGKKAAAASRHAELVAANIRTLIEGGAELDTYQPAEPSIVIPLGPSNGATYAPAYGGLLGAETTSELKGKDLMVEMFADVFGGERNSV